MACKTFELLFVLLLIITTSNSENTTLSSNSTTSSPIRLATKPPSNLNTSIDPKLQTIETTTNSDYGDFIEENSTLSSTTLVDELTSEESIVNITSPANETDLILTTTEETPSSTSETPVFNRTKFAYGHYCTCDLTIGSCDVNCCCDTDCSEADVNVFSKCLPAEIYTPDKRFCYQTELVVANHTQYLAERRSPAGPLCILVDNLKNGFLFSEREQVENLTDFIELTLRHKTYLRPEERRFQILKSNFTEEGEESEEDFANTIPREFDAQFYLIGNPLWTYQRDVQAPGIFALPANFDCSLISPIQYGHDSSVTCHRGPVSNCDQMPYMSASDFFDFSVIRSPGAYRNKTNPFVEMSVRVCSQTYEAKVCHFMHENGPIHRATEGCNNVVTFAHYNITHDGIEGIRSIVATIELTNFSMIVETEEKALIPQTFSYNHFWTSDNSSSTKSRSGNPGYQSGKPILMGYLTKNQSGENYFIDREGEKFLHVMKTSLNCEQANFTDRYLVKFGENFHSGCTIQVSQSELADQCDQLKNNIIGILVGIGKEDINSVSKHKSGLKLVDRYELQRFAVFGNSQEQHPGDWFHPLFSNFPVLSLTGTKKSSKISLEGSCKNVVTSLHIEIAYAKTGSVANPQSKIVGIHYRFGRPEDVTFRCLGLACRHPSNKSLRIDVMSSVSFLDVSQPAVAKYMDYPVIEARFPHDFFYPFITTSSADSYHFTSLDLHKFIFSCSLLVCFNFF